MKNAIQTKAIVEETLTQLGSSSAKICFYLPNPPQLTPRLNSALMLQLGATSANDMDTGLLLQSGDIDALIKLNGNHWRKIFVIVAKICAPDEQWRNYIPSILLQNEKIHFNSKEFAPCATFHIICGAQACLSLGLEKPEAKEIRVFELQSLKKGKGVVITTPYLDYRQYPNALIEQTRQELYSTPPA